jgi:hypothetical protein
MIINMVRIKDKPTGLFEKTTLYMRIYLFDTKKFFKKKRFGFYGGIPLCVNRILNYGYGGIKVFNQQVKYIII